MKEKLESETKIKISVALLDKEKISIADEMFASLDKVNESEIRKKDYAKERKEELVKYMGIVADRRASIRDGHLSDGSKMEMTDEILSAMNVIAEIERDIEIHNALMGLDITQFQAKADACKIKLISGKDMKWIDVKMVKDFAGKKKTYFDKTSGEAIRTVPMTPEDLQMELPEK